MKKIIELGSKIISGVRSPHECIDENYKYEQIRGTLISPSGKKQNITC